MDKHSCGNSHSPSSRWKRLGIKKKWKPAPLKSNTTNCGEHPRVSCVPVPVFTVFQIQFSWFYSLVLTFACFNVTWIPHFDYQYWSLLSCYTPCLPALRFSPFCVTVTVTQKGTGDTWMKTGPRPGKNSRRTKQEWREHQITGSHTSLTDQEEHKRKTDRWEHRWVGSREWQQDTRG